MNSIANPQQPSRVLLRLSGDISIKAKPTRNQFERRLVQNLRDALRSVGDEAKVHPGHNRILVDTARPESIEALARVFGVQTVSPTVEAPLTDLADVVRRGTALFSDHVRGRRFAVRARRVGDRVQANFRSGEVERELGAALLADSAGVDLSNPEVTASVELFRNRVFFFAERKRGPAGLPLGVQGRALALVSGGFDSAVAAWQVQKRGVELDYLFCNLGGATHRQGTLRVMKVIADRWSYGTKPRLYSVDFAPVVDQLRSHTEERYWQILLKRSMLRAAEQVAEETGALALVTGEALGQVSSQTLQNLAVISDATERMILRPLVGLNKEEIIDQSRHIGTFDFSSIVGEYCAIVPGRPATAAKLDVVREQESKLDPGVLDKCLAQRERLALRALDLEAFSVPGLEIETVPPGATVIDLRSRRVYADWHFPEAVYLDFGDALRAYPSFAPDSAYVLYCEFGLKSAHLAELMRDAGFEAFNFRGGMKKLREIASANERTR